MTTYTTMNKDSGKLMIEIRTFSLYLQIRITKPYCKNQNKIP